MEHSSPEEWNEAAEFFGISVETLKTGEPIILPKVWDISVPFTPY